VQAALAQLMHHYRFVHRLQQARSELGDSESMHSKSLRLALAGLAAKP